MAGIKNPLQQRGWTLPPGSGGENDFLMQMEILKATAPVYCHFCGKEIIVLAAAEGDFHAAERTSQERQLGAHLACYRQAQQA